MTRGRFVEYVLDHPDVRPVWKKFTEHDFVLGMGSGKLPVDRFKEYLVQDYLYLVGVLDFVLHLQKLTDCACSGSFRPEQRTRRV